MMSPSTVVMACSFLIVSSSIFLEGCIFQCHIGGATRVKECEWERTEGRVCPVIDKRCSDFVKQSLELWFLLTD